MLQVLLVDDEPLILSGIKHLLDWERQGCVVAGTAASGKEALRLLEELRPDIVVCDIAMPDLSGLELLKKANRDYPEMVFIMLTNHQEFELARESLRNRAVEYLLKNKLEREDLEKALKTAVTERENRNALSRLNRGGEETGAPFSGGVPGRIAKAVLALADPSRPLGAGNTALLRGARMLSGFALGAIFLDYSALPEAREEEAREEADGPESPGGDIKRLINWEKEIAGRLAASLFSQSLVLIPPPDEGLPSRRLLLYLWDLKRGEWEIRAKLFGEQLGKTSAQITRLGVRVRFSGRAEDEGELEIWRSRLPSLLLPDLPGQEGRRQSAPAGHAEIIARVRQYVLDNLERPLRLQDLANHAAISAGYLSTIFKKEFNQNLMDYINTIKIERACALLRQGNYRIYEISYLLGYENAYYFTRVFRRHTGLSPSEYQKKERREDT